MEKNVKINYFSGIENNFVGNWSGSLEAYIESVKSKTPGERSRFEKELLKLYQQAQEKATKFCLDKVEKKIMDSVQNNRPIAIAIIILVIVVVFSKIK